MRHTLFALLLFIASVVQAQSFFDRVDAFLSENVSKDGSINYSGIAKQPAQLNQLVKEIAELNLSNKRVSAEFMKAFYLNAYNILVIKQVVDRYPIEGPLAVDGFFNSINQTVMGEQMTLDGLEKGTLYKQFPDPRLHFVLVCAAKGCPPLAAYAYQPTTLDEQLTRRTREVLNLDWFIRVKDNKTEVSQIFQWYEGDFNSSAGNVRSFINNYREQKIGEKQAVTYYEYDWSLNKQKTPKY